MSEPAAPATPQEPLPKSIEEFDKLIEDDVSAFVTASAKIGGLVEEQVRRIRARHSQRLMSNRQKRCSQPSRLSERIS